jgi:FkbM family methyltransferase
MSRQDVEQLGVSGATKDNLAKILNSSYLYVDKEELSVGQWLANTGYWESWITSWMTKNIKEGFICIDIGANYGYYTRVMQQLAKNSGEVHAFEANPEVFDMLGKSLTDYKDEKFARAFVYPIAISDNKGEVELSIASKYLGGATIVFGADLPSNIENNLWDKKITVKSNTLDNYDFDHIDLIKMDIEGAEYLAWRGMQNTLDKTDVVVLELGSYSHNELKDDIFNRYEVTFIDTDGSEKELTRNQLDNLDDLIMAVLRRKNA